VWARAGSLGPTFADRLRQGDPRHFTPILPGAITAAADTYDGGELSTTPSAVRSGYPVAVPTIDADVRLRPWRASDLPLLERILGDPAMTAYLGGPESHGELRQLNAEYAAVSPAEGQVFVILADAESAGSVGFWRLDWQGATFWEIGCSVLPEYQGHGIGRRGLMLAAGLAQAAAPGREIHAFPSIDNAPSNAMCRRAGFTLAGQADYEYPAGNPMRVNDWVLPHRLSLATEDDP
jgi:RimJ/RimL family protein N-acetyltransferase